MKNHNPHLNTFSDLVSDGVDLFTEAISGTLKQKLDQLIRGPAALHNSVGIRDAVHEVTEVTGYPARWNPEETLVVLTVPHASRHWQVIACDHGGDIFEILLPANVRYPLGQVPGSLAVHLLTRNARIPFGGFDLFAAEGSLSINCRASIPTEAVTGELLYTTIQILVAEVTTLYEQFKL